MRRIESKGLVAIALALAVLGSAAVVASVPAAAAPVPDPAAAWGAGFGDWWRAHAKDVAQFTSCLVDGLAGARLLAVGVAGVGGWAAAVAVAAAAIGCAS